MTAIGGVTPIHTKITKIIVVLNLAYHKAEMTVESQKGRVLRNGYLRDNKEKERFLKKND